VKVRTSASAKNWRNFDSLGFAAVYPDIFTAIPKEPEFLGLYFLRYNVNVADRSKDWFKQAERDLGQARDSRDHDRHEWACFAAQQAAEKAVKALHLSLKQEAWGHVVAQLLTELPTSVNVPKELIEKGRVLDNFYIPTRYANGHPSGAPFEHYGPLQSSEAIQYAGEILEFVRDQMA
jgi:HEPN domain-containing protein